MSALVLASGSPRRAQLLRQLNLSFSVVTPDIDERPRPGESARAYVRRMSTEKLGKARSMLAGEPVIVCADTEVVLDGNILGKPRDESDCVKMLLSLSARDHNVLTSVTMAGGGKERTFIVETNVSFRRLTSSECRNYWATGEPCDKAGGYGIQGVGAIFVKKIEGSYSNVVGLPLMEVARGLERFGIACLPDRKERSRARTKS